MRRMFLLSGLAVSVAGCETVQAVHSVDLANAEAPAGSFQGAYALPSTVLIVTVKEAGAGAGGAGGDKAATGVTVTNTVNVTAPLAAGKDADKTPKKEEAPKQATPPAEVKCADVVKAYNDARRKHDAFIEADIGRRETLELLSVHEPFTKTDEKAALKGMAELVSARQAEDAAIQKAVALYKDHAARCMAVTVEISQDIVPDRSRLFGLYVQQTDYAATTLTTKIGEDGLLTEVGASVDDKIGDVVVAGVKSLVSFAYLVDPTALGAHLSAASLVGSATAAASLAQTKKLSVQDQLLKFLAQTSMPRLQPLPALILPPKEPQRYDLAEVWSPRAGPARSVRIWNTLSLTVECDSGKGATPGAEPLGGVLISMPRSCRARVIDVDKDGTWVRADAHFAAQDSREVLVLPVERTTFVARKTTYAFSKGRLTQANYDRPSSAARGAAYPGEIIAGGINQLSLAVQGRKGATQGEADRINAQANLYTAQSALIKARSDARTAAANEGKPATSEPEASPQP